MKKFALLSLTALLNLFLVTVFLSHGVLAQEQSSGQSEFFGHEEYEPIEWDAIEDDTLSDPPAEDIWVPEVAEENGYYEKVKCWFEDFGEEDAPPEDE